MTPKPVRTNGKRTAAQQIVADGYASGMSQAEIAEKAGIQFNSVPVLAARMGIKRPKKPPKPVVARRPPYAGFDRYEPPWGGPSITPDVRMPAGQR